MLDLLFDASFMASVPRFVTPILLAALGGALCERAGVFNIALEGFILTGAFAAVLGSYFSGSPWLGAIAAMAAGIAIGLVFADAMERLIATQFWVVERQDVTVNFVEPRSPDVRHALARLPGVVAVEPQRAVAARIRAGHRERYLSIVGVSPGSRLRRIIPTTPVRPTPRVTV